MKESKLKDRVKLFLILEGILIPAILIISIVVNLFKGTSIMNNINVYYYGFGVIVMVTAIPSLYRRPYSQKGMYRKVMGEMFSLKKTGDEPIHVENNSYSDENPFLTGLFIVLGGAVLLLIGFIIERVFNII